MMRIKQAFFTMGAPQKVNNTIGKNYNEPLSIKSLTGPRRVRIFFFSKKYYWNAPRIVDTMNDNNGKMSPF